MRSPNFPRKSACYRWEVFTNLGRVKILPGYVQHLVKVNFKVLADRKRIYRTMAALGNHEFPALASLFFWAMRWAGPLAKTKSWWGPCRCRRWIWDSQKIIPPHLSQTRHVFAPNLLNIQLSPGILNPHMGYFCLFSCSLKKIGIQFSLHRFKLKPKSFKWFSQRHWAHHWWSRDVKQS